MAKTRLQPGMTLHGVNLDLAGSEIPPDQATMAINMIVAENALQRIGGYQNLFGTPLDAPRHLQSQIVGQQTYWIYIGDTIQGATDGTSHFDLTHASGITASYQWTTDLINNLIVANNPNDDPMYWDGNTSNNFVTLPNWLANTKCQALRTFGTYLFALGIEDASGTRLNEVAWSDEATVGTVPQTWVPASSNDAGNRELSDTQGVLIDAARLRNSLIIYKEFSTYRCDFVGGNDVFGFQLLYETVGCIAANAVVEGDNRHYVMARDDIIRHDGISDPVSIADRWVRNFYVNNLNESQAARAFAVNNLSDSEIWFCFPESGAEEPTIALVYNIQEQRWGVRDIAFPYIISGLVAPPTTSFTYDTVSDTYDATTLTYNQNTAGSGELNLLAADETNTRLVGIDQVTDDRGGNITSSVTRTGLVLGDPQRLKLVTAIYPRIVGTAGQVIQIRCGYQNEINDPVTWGSWQNYTIGSSVRADFDVMGRYIALQMQNISDAIWRLESFDLEYQIRGRHVV